MDINDVKTACQEIVEQRRKDNLKDEANIIKSAFNELLLKLYEKEQNNKNKKDLFDI